MSAIGAESSEMVRGSSDMVTIVPASTAGQGRMWTEQSGGTGFGKDASNLWKVADYTKMRKYKWLFVNGCEYRSSSLILMNNDKSVEDMTLLWTFYLTLWPTDPSLLNIPHTFGLVIMRPSPTVRAYRGGQFLSFACMFRLQKYFMNYDKIQIWGTHYICRKNPRCSLRCWL